MPANDPLIRAPLSSPSKFTVHQAGLGGDSFFSLSLLCVGQAELDSPENTILQGSRPRPRVNFENEPWPIMRGKWLLRRGHPRV